jgi:hypothetical protein
MLACDKNDMIFWTGKIMSEVFASCTTSPLSFVVMARDPGSTCTREGEGGGEREERG